MSVKSEYVKAQQQIRDHECHWPGCTRQVKPALWGCSTHWYRLPPALRAKIWETYEPGQEVDGTPSAEYLEIADAVQLWIKEYGGDA